MLKKNTGYSAFHYIDLPSYDNQDDVKHKKPFIEQVENALRNDLQEYDTFGCCIKNCHTHAGSKLHFHNFIEAELLFHNSYYNRAFARLTVEWIRKEYLEDKTDYKNILFIGYEMYSELYLQEIVEQVKEIEPEENELKKYGYCVYETISKTLPNGSRKKDVHIRNLEKVESGIIKIIHGDQIVEFKDEETLCVFIVPINTSLSTMDKMIAKFLGKVYDKNFRFNRAHICLITLGDGGGGNFFGKNNDKLIPCKSKFENLDDAEIKNFVHIDVENDNLARKCPDCFPDINNGKDLTDENPMFGVNRDSVVPMLKIDQRKYLEPIDEEVSNISIQNLSKVYKLSEFLQYHHIARGENHFQYYFDTEKFLQKNTSDIQIFLEGYKYIFKTQSGHHTFDYLIAPRHQSNSGWVHLVNKTLFNSNARIIYFDIEKEFRSNIKAKYSDLIAALENIQNSRQKFTLRFHFVDDAIQSGATFMRAKNLLTSLTESILDTSNTSLFDSIILLVNRLSTDSKRFYLDNEKTEKFLSYVNVNISSMRNYEDACVLCKLISDYHSINNECATNRLSNICLDVIRQHEVCSSFDIGKNGIDEAFSKDEKRYVFYLSHFLNECMGNKIFFENNVFLENEPNKVIGEIKEFLLRCYDSMKIQKMLNIGEEYVKRQLFKAAFIKVISRPFFTYHIRFRQAAFSFCLEKINGILLENVSLDVSSLVSQINNISVDIEAVYKKSLQNTEIIDKVNNDVVNLTQALNQFYQVCFPSILLRTLVKALADMNANYLIREKVINKLFEISAKGEQLSSSIIRMITRVKEPMSECGNNPFIESLKNEEELMYLAKSLFTNDSLLHYLKKDIVLSRDETKSLVLEYILLTGGEKLYFNSGNNSPNENEYAGEENKFEDFVGENKMLTIKGKLYLENNTILKNILGNDGNLNKLIKELEVSKGTYKADNLYFFENFKSFWNVNTSKCMTKRASDIEVLKNFKGFFDKYREFKSCINSFAHPDTRTRRNFIKAMNDMIDAITGESELRAIAFVHDSNEENPLFQFYTLSGVSNDSNENIPLPNCKYNDLTISQAFFHDDNIKEIKDKLNDTEEDFFFVEDKLSRTKKKETLIVRFSRNKTELMYDNQSNNIMSDESIYIQIFGFDKTRQMHWFILKLLMSLRENVIKLIDDVNLQELIEERKVEMKQKALSINKATTHSKAEKYFMTRPITENIGKYTEISKKILADWEDDESINLDELTKAYEEKLNGLNDVNRVERKSYSDIMMLPSHKLRHRWTLYDKYYQLLSDEILSSFYRKIITQNIIISRETVSLKKMIKTVLDPVEFKECSDVGYKSEACITMLNEAGELVKCKIIFTFDKNNADGYIAYTYEHTCNMSIYFFIIILMAMNAVQHGTFNSKSNMHELEVTISANKLTFANDVREEQIPRAEQEMKYWYIPPWVFDKGKQHITIWTLLHMSCDENKIKFEAKYDKKNKKFITKFIFGGEKG